MKRLFILIVALTFALVSFAQTQEETVDRMSEDVKIPILDTMSTVAWYLQCKKIKTNTNKDDPKTMGLVVAKGTYHPISLSAKVSGITVTMCDLSFNVSEKQVTFN